METRYMNEIINANDPQDFMFEVFEVQEVQFNVSTSITLDGKTKEVNANAKVDNRNNYWVTG